MFKGITFASPDYFWLLLLIPVLVAWYFYRQKKNNADIQVSSNGRVRGSQEGDQALSLSWAVCTEDAGADLPDPRAYAAASKKAGMDISVEGIDIILAMDISGSMMAMDFKPNRIEASKNLAMEFVDGRPNDRIGLVIFSGEAFTQCPLTTDHAVLKNLFADIHTGMIEDGTAIGDGLATALNRLRGSKAISKVIILLTDGVNNMGSIDPLSAAEIAKLYGVRIYSRRDRDHGRCSLPGANAIRDPDNAYEGGYR